MFCYLEQIQELKLEIQIQHAYQHLHKQQKYYNNQY